jgi:hypothetical protein
MEITVLPTLVHLINPFRSPPGSEHDVAQRMTMASIRRAKAYAEQRGVEVDVVATCYAEDVAAVEPPARLLPLLSRSVQDVAPLKPVRKLPLIDELIKIGGQHGYGEYLIFTNIDITLQPYFYYHVARLIKRVRRYAPVFLINRRVIPVVTTDPEQICKAYPVRGHGHIGTDCFVFPKQWTQRLDLGNLCIGSASFDSCLAASLDLISGYRMRVFERQELTFHLGEEETWHQQDEYLQYNAKEANRVMERLSSVGGRPPVWSLFACRRDFLLGGPFRRRWPFVHAALWRIIEFMSLWRTRRLLRAYLSAGNRG